MPSSVGAGGEDDDESGLPAMDEDDIAIYKQRLVNYLRPGETVLMALRRLGELGCRLLSGRNWITACACWRNTTMILEHHGHEVLVVVW